MIVKLSTGDLDDPAVVSFIADYRATVLAGLGFVMSDAQIVCSRFLYERHDMHECEGGGKS